MRSIIHYRGQNLMKKSVTLLLLAAAVLSACNTVRGVGRDVQSVGKTVERAGD